MSSYQRWCLLLVFICFSGLSFSQSLWSPIDDESTFSDEEPIEKASSSRDFKLNISTMKALLAEAPHESYAPMRTSGTQIALPMPDGRLISFQVVKYDAVEPGLLTKYPFLQTYRGIAIEHDMTARLIFTMDGFNAFVRHPDGFVTVAKKYASVENVYHSFFNHDVLPHEDLLAIPASIPAHGHHHADGEEDHDHLGLGSILQETYDLKVYRLAITTTGEWTNNWGGGNTSSAIGIITTTVNQINEVYENDVAVRFVLVAENDELIFLDGESDPFPLSINTETSDLAQLGTPTINQIIGEESYDIGHVFGTVGGGVARLESVCRNDKGWGYSGPFGTYNGSQFYLLVSHEMGHQFDAPHPFNFCDGENESPDAGYEPGSGSTIMSYAGASTCNSQWIELMSDPYFHNGSISRMIEFVRMAGGSQCGSELSHNNTVPEAIIDYEDGFFIPISTPFWLEASSSDAEGDDVTYCWEQYDLGPPSQLGNPIDNAPIFRSFPPTADPFRVFPQWNQIFFGASNLNEVLPTYNRDLTFRVTVRDNSDEAGLVNWEQVEFDATASAGPFVVLAPTLDEVVTANTLYRVEWDVANTDGPLVNSQIVDIYLSEGGSDFDVLLADNVPNNGERLVEIPASTSGNGRIMVRSADNIFLNVTDEFNVEEASTAGFDFAPTLDEVLVCLPDDAELQLQTSSILDFDGNLEMELLNSLPAGITHSFSNSATAAGDDNTLLLEFPDFDANETFDVVIRCFAEGVDTIDRVIQVRTVSNNFEDMLIANPPNGAEGVELNPVFSWSPSVNAETYTIEVATNPSFVASSIVEVAEGVATTSYSLGSSLDESQVYFWRISGENDCGTGASTNISAFHTLNLSCAEYESQDVPKAISASGTPTVESSLEVSGGGSISDVNIPNINLTHQNIGQVTLTLISPEADEVVLVDRKCLFFPNHSRGYDDESPDEYECSLTTDGRIYQPDGSLSDFQGSNSSGTWTLRVRDNEPGSGGSLNSWRIEICGNLQLNPPSLLRNDTLFVPQPFSSEIITNTQLRTEDPNTPDDEIQYILTSIPVHGNLELDGQVLEVGDDFSQQDIDDNVLQYVHLQNDTIIDGFDFIVLDGEGGFIGDNRFIISTGDAVFAENIISEDPLARLYPNPTSNEIFITPLTVSSLERVEIRNVHGKLVQVQDQVIQSVQRVGLESLTPGMYFVTLYAGQLRYTDRIMVR